jgi:hypothetical protein
MMNEDYVKENEMNEDYVKGFMAKAAELGVDPELLVKEGGKAQMAMRALKTTGSYLKGVGRGAGDAARSAGKAVVRKGVKEPAVHFTRGMVADTMGEGMKEVGKGVGKVLAVGTGVGLAGRGAIDMARNPKSSAWGKKEKIKYHRRRGYPKQVPERL